jgi:hypothetical protein
VIRAQEVVDDAKAARAEAVHATAASAQDVTEVWERAMTLIKEAEAHATLAESVDQERVSKAEAKSAASLASTREEADGFTRKVDLLEGELADASKAQDTAEANFSGLCDRVVDVNRWQKDVERLCRDLVQELILLQNMGFELCQAIVGPSTLWGHQSEGMRIDSIRHTEMVGQVVALQVMVSSAMQSALGHSPTEAF